MTPAEVGVYAILLNEMYARGVALDMTQAKLARLCCCPPGSFGTILADLIESGKIVRLECGLWNERVEKAFISLRSVVHTKQTAGEQSGKKRRKNSGAAERAFNTRATPDELSQVSDIEEPSGSSLDRDPPKSKPPPKARLPDDWALSDEGWAYAREHGIPEAIIHDEARGFHAYWSDRSDRDARKSERGWEQCWQSWVRRICTRYQGRGVAGGTSPGGSGQGGSIASIVARRRASG